MNPPNFSGSTWPELRQWAARLIHDLRGVGDPPVAGSVTLDTSVGTTTVPNSAMSKGRKVFLFPTTANAATEFGAGTLHISSKDKGSFVIAHVNSATTGRTFDYLII